MIYHVSIHGCDKNSGAESAPLRTINRAAALAHPGDTVIVHEGEYREWVDPIRGGLHENLRITYCAAEGEHVVIKGSEIVTDWEKVNGTVWKKALPNSMFGDWNPYTERIFGDWFENPRDYHVHTGEVYINGKSCYEASSLQDVYEAMPYQWHWQAFEGFIPKEPILDVEQTKYRWFAEVDDETTTLFVNFQNFNPNENLIEINVRKCVFYPKNTGRSYVTVRGFEMCHAACPYTPPTADQPALIGPNWAKGWIIEDNDLHDARCSCISIGKEASTGDMDCTKYNRKHSHYYQTEAVFRALKAGWSKETVGSHIIRNNKIHDCGQNGVVGHLGCVFSQIEHNEIYNIAVKHEFFAHEIGGIKLHAAIDVVIENNNIHHCTLGTWLDWEAQGTRITKNVYHHNYRDFFIEVTHGPALVDNNLFMDDYSIMYMAQGTAFVHNLIMGDVRNLPVLDRQMPYHFPHSTDVLGITKVFGGDDRYYNNLFLGACKEKLRHATREDIPLIYDTIQEVTKNYSAPEEYYEGMKQWSFKYDPKQAVWFGGNAYAGDAKPFRAEVEPIETDGMSASVDKVGDEWVLTLSVPESVANANCEAVTTTGLGAPAFSEERYENPDGSDVDFTLDLLGNRRNGNTIPGPIAKLKAGEQKITVWKA
ncbi:MAG: right-handed parallel beta-helix repeat-containing protein [Clostridia bacterium]|nr:right-handed parallel beta-helix repeat-containing protein [Clostridia bacterium]